MKTIEQPVAIVTGASSGIGLSLTQTLLERGWRVVGTSRTISKSKDLKPSTHLVLVDGEASKKETAVQVVDAAIKHFGRIDLLVNNAGIFVSKSFTDYTEDEYNQVMNTNVASMFFMTQQVIPQMRHQHSGHVVNISATLADQPAGGVPAFLAILSKSPMPAVSKALALEFAADNIRFNTVSPGVVNTPMHANEDHAALAKFHPLNRIAESSDIVDAVLYLQNATFVTGENIHVDGTRGRPGPGQETREAEHLPGCDGAIHGSRRRGRRSLRPVCPALQQRKRSRSNGLRFGQPAERHAGRRGNRLRDLLTPKSKIKPST